MGSSEKDVLADQQLQLPLLPVVIIASPSGHPADLLVDKGVNDDDDDEDGGDGDCCVDGDGTDAEYDAHADANGDGDGRRGWS